MTWVLIALALLLLLFISQVEHFTDTEFTNVTRPCACPSTGPCINSGCKAWESRVGAVAPSNAVVSDYIAVLAAFYDTVYVPSATKPTEAQVTTFLSSSAGTVAGVDSSSIKKLIMDGFHIDKTGTAAANEEKTQMFKPSDENLAPKDGRDEVRTREEDGYTPADSTISTRFAEGEYEPVTQSNPINPGMWNDGSKNWKGPRPASVCACAENVM